MLSEIAEPILEDGINELRSQLIANQQKKRLRDRGGSANSLRVEVISKDGSIAGQLYGFERWIIQQKGRGPNKSGKPGRELVERIRGWAKRHGIEEKAAYPIALKIARVGTLVPNPHNPGGVLSEVLNADNVRGLIAPRLRGALFAGIKSALFTPK